MENCKFCESLGIKPNCAKCNLQKSRHGEKRDPHEIPDTIEKIVENIKTGNHNEYIVGDWKKIKLLGVIEITLVVIGKFHDTVADDGSLADVSFAIFGIPFAFPYDSLRRIEHNDESAMNKIYLNFILKTLPNVLQDSIVVIEKPTLFEKDITEKNKIFLFSAKEIFGEDTRNYLGALLTVKDEGQQYDLFSRNDAMLLKRNFEQGTYIWLRTLTAKEYHRAISVGHDDSEYLSYTHIHNSKCHNMLVGFAITSDQ